MKPIRYRAAEITRLLDTALELLTTLLAHELDTLDALPSESHQQALLTRIHTFIQEHLGNPELSPATIARAHHISLRRLQQLFAATDKTPAAWIRRQRLERCRRALMDPCQHERPIHAVAARWGFADHAHFTRLFRATFGMSPSEHRAAHDMRRTTNRVREQTTP